MNHTQKNKNITTQFVIVVAVFVTCLIASNIVAVKIADIFGRFVPAAIIIFPISYIIGDILTEVYGYDRAKQVIWLGFFCNALAVLAFWIGGLIPPAPFWENQDSYEIILGSTPRLLFASFIAYLIGELSNSFTLSRLKVWTNGKSLWVRTIGSTVIGQGLDSSVFITVAFIGILSNADLFELIITQWVIKVLYEVIATPVTYVVVRKLKELENDDHFDGNISLNPLPKLRMD
ncbi:MAG: queuosine precursor transporter [SAR202 cluster bacterium]|nr:queuosine precursor transporter [SAR202 cluster bacterium]|tara:strand:- start:286 stop:984 length:699 start_codon:yes stop_codon:yes gene_type:complete